MQTKIDSTQHGFWERFLINIPFVLIVILIVACIGVGALALFYTFVCSVAFKSAMISLLLFGGSFIFVGIGLLMIEVFKKYHKFYEKKMDVAPPSEEVATKTYDTKQKTFKDYLTYENVCLAILLVGAILCIISAALGSIERDKWIEDTKSYYNQAGYYNENKDFTLSYRVDGQLASDKQVEKIVIELENKVAVVKYDSSVRDLITIDGYSSYDGQLSVFSLDNNRQIKLSEGDAPTLDGALEKLMFFLWIDTKYERQVIITIPEAYRTTIEIVGEYILAQE